MSNSYNPLIPMNPCTAFLSLSRSQRAAIELSLHWIFVIFIGAIILTFFITIVVKQRNIAEQELLADLRATFRSYVVGAQSTSRGAVEVATFGHPFTYSCVDTGEESCLCTFAVGDKQRQSFTVSPSVLFAPATIGAAPDTVVIWSLPWRMPFPATNFVYFILPDTRFIFVYDDTATSAQTIESFFTYELTDTMPKELVPLSQLSQLEDTGYRLHKMIFLGTFATPKPAEFPGFLDRELPLFMKNDETKIVYATVQTALDTEIGELFFFRYDPATDSFQKEKESRFVGLPAAIGSFFVDDGTTYACVMSNAFVNLKTVATVQLERTKILNEKGICSAFYTPRDQQHFEKLIAFADEPKTWDTQNYNDLVNAVGSLSTVNERLEQNSCPLLY